MLPEEHQQQLDERRRWADQLLETDPDYIDWINESYEEYAQERQHASKD